MLLAVCSLVSDCVTTLWHACERGTQPQTCRYSLSTSSFHDNAGDLVRSHEGALVSQSTETKQSSVQAAAAPELLQSQHEQDLGVRASSSYRAGSCTSSVSQVSSLQGIAQQKSGLRAVPQAGQVVATSFKSPMTKSPFGVLT